MPLTKKQFKRFYKLISLMKQKRYPNAKTFADKLREADLYENENIACTPKTIRRDIKILTNDYGAPIDFDRKNNGYYLKYEWSYEFPVLKDEAMLGALLGSKLARDLMPEPIKSQINNAMDEELTTNGPDFLDTTYIESLIAASGVKVHIDPYIFKTVFDAWQNHEAIDIKYRSAKNKISERRIDPHIITYYNSAWYIKGFCIDKDDIRVFAIHRLLEAEATGLYFEADPLMIQDAKNGNIFTFKTIKNIEIECSREIAGYVNEQHEFYDETIKEHKDGSVTVNIPAAPEHEIMKWVLSEGGNAKIIKPKSLAKKVVEAAKKVAEVNCS